MTKVALGAAVVPPVLRFIERPWVLHAAFLHFIGPIGDPAEKGDKGEGGRVRPGI